MKRILPFLPILFLFLPALLFINGIDEEAVAKKKAADDYRANIEATMFTDPAQFGWTGNENRCKPGKVSHDMYVKILKRINYYRRLSGLSDNIVLDSGWNKYAQAAALIMFANNTVDHNPNPGMKCFSQEGKTGASTSNLSIFSGVSIQDLISDEVEDGGTTSNKDCGHRRWILYSQAYKFGFGATSGSYALRDFSTDAEKDTSSFHGSIPEYFGYPFKGYVPYQSVFCKWSFAIPGGGDFSQAKVSVIAGDKPIPTTIINRNTNNFGDPTLIWGINGLKEDFDYTYYDMTKKRAGMVTLGLLNKKVTVKISDVKVEGKMKSYSYSFTIIDPDEWK
jgi:hypothetical protein